MQAGRRFGRFFSSSILAALLIAASASVSFAEAAAVLGSLIPTPQRIEEGEGRVAVANGMRVLLPEEAGRPEWVAARALAETVKERWDVDLRLDRAGQIPEEQPAIRFALVANLLPEVEIPDQAYRLTIRAEGALIEAPAAVGLTYGLRTLQQMTRLSPHPEWPACTIEDWPQFPNRGFYHDVSRGKVPTRETLKEIAETLAELKINQFQLYVEHPFDFAFDPEIGAGAGTPLTSEDILALDHFCRDRHIAFVPSIQSMGHMGRILAIPRYWELAEVEPTKTWWEMSWNERMGGFTIDLHSEGGQRLLHRLWDDFVPLFSAPYVNACSDETYDLGQGRNKELAEELGEGGLYLANINHLNELAKSYGKRLMFWGDIVKKHPDFIPQIPKDTILLNWGYSANADFESCELFQQAGLDFYVCPGASGWNRVVNALTNADLNIRRYAAAGQKYGAIGLLNTDWGDHGHFNLLGGSMHPIALGSEVSWNADAPKPEAEFDAAWSRLVFGEPDASALTALKRATDFAARLPTWLIIYRPLREAEQAAEEGHGRRRRRPWWIDAIEGTEREVFVEALNESRVAERLWGAVRQRQEGDSALTAAELELGARFNAMAARKLLLRRDLRELGDEIEARLTLANALETWADEMEDLWPRYERLWFARNRASLLHEVEEVYDEALIDARHEAVSIKAAVQEEIRAAQEAEEAEEEDTTD